MSKPKKSPLAEIDAVAEKLDPGHLGRVNEALRAEIAAMRTEYREIRDLAVEKIRLLRERAKKAEADFEELKALWEKNAAPMVEELRAAFEEPGDNAQNVARRALAWKERAEKAEALLQSADSLAFHAGDGWYVFATRQTSDGKFWSVHDVGKSWRCGDLTFDQAIAEARKRAGLT